MDEGEGHLRREDLGRLQRKELPAREVIEMLKHLARGCETCRALVASVVRIRPEKAAEAAAAAPVDPYELPFARALTRVRAHLTELRLARASALSELEIIFSAEDGENELSLSEPSKKTLPTRRWVWCELLIDAAGELRGSDLPGALDLAGLAAQTVDSLEEPFPAEALSDLRGRTWMEFGNLLRIDADLDGAEASLHYAEHQLRSGTGDPLLTARLLDLTSSLLRARRHFPQALNLLEDAGKLYLTSGERHLAGSVLVSTGLALLYSGEPEKAIQTLSKALDLLDHQRESAVIFAAMHNLLLALVEAGQPKQAAQFLWRARRVYEFGSEKNRVRLTGLEGCIARELGQYTRAERLFRQAKAGYEAAGEPYQAATAALDLGSVLLAQGRPAEVLRLVEKMLNTFWALRIEQKAIAAVLLLRQALLQGTATAKLAREVADTLRRLGG